MRPHMPKGVDWRSENGWERNNHAYMYTLPQVNVFVFGVCYVMLCYDVDFVSRFGRRLL